MTIFEFKIARVEENELPSLMEAESPIPPGEFKTLYVVAETEEKAIQKADAYVAKTKYAEIEDKKIIR